MLPCPGGIFFTIGFEVAEVIELGIEQVRAGDVCQRGQDR
jgi:hypothetical protein